MRKHQLVSRHVKFELVYISFPPKSITCTEQVSYRSDLSQDQCRRGDLSPRFVAAICRIVCLDLNDRTGIMNYRTEKTIQVDVVNLNLTMRAFTDSFIVLNPGQNYTVSELHHYHVFR